MNLRALLWPASSVASLGVALYAFVLREQRVAVPARPGAMIAPAPPLEAAPGRTPARVVDHPQARAVASWLVLLIVATAAGVSRLRYIVSFHGTFGSGDAHSVLVHALLMRSGTLRAAPDLVISGDTFGQPPLIPALLAAVSRATTLSLEQTTLIVTPALTVAAIIALTQVLRRRFGWALALASGSLIAILPKLSFDSTEPEKSPYVLACVIFALAAIDASRDRPRLVVVAGAFTALAMLAHTTGYLFLPVLAFSYVLVQGRPYARALNRNAALALVLPAAAVIVYFALARWFPHAAPTGSAGAGDGNVVPPFVQQYIDAFTNLAHGRVGDRAWHAYFNGLRTQLGTPVLVLAIAGFARGCYALVVERDGRIAPFVIWAAWITLAFGIQYPSASHGSRYPSYVTPAYLVLAAYFVASLPWTSRFGYAGTAALALFVSFAGWTYASAPDPGLRDLYQSHQKAAHYIDDQRLLDDGGMLYLGWPSVTLNVLEGRPEYQDRLYEFGFGQRPLDEFTPQFIDARGIKYFLYDKTGNDYFHSADVVRNQLADTMVLREVATFTGRPGSYVTLYELYDRTPWRPGDVASWFGRTPASAPADLLANGDLCASTDGGAAGWEENGWVQLVPARPTGSGCGVLVLNANEYGGARQEVTGIEGGAPVSVLVALRQANWDSARTARVSIYGGPKNGLLGQYDLNLSDNPSYAAVEAFVPDTATPLRVVIASGPGDDGDLIIERAALVPGRLSDVLSGVPAR
ncbi:MAG TPA: hypothetical protein VFC53_03485 [Dehalococcoidia bacterium]|nr:hypothetical protein [Dehalococcoidia bacterium]